LAAAPLRRSLRRGGYVSKLVGNEPAEDCVDGRGEEDGGHRGDSGGRERSTSRYAGLGESTMRPRWLP